MTQTPRNQESRFNSRSKEGGSLIIDDDSLFMSSSRYLPWETFTSIIRYAPPGNRYSGRRVWSSESLVNHGKASSWIDPQSTLASTAPSRKTETSQSEVGIAPEAQTLLHSPQINSCKVSETYLTKFCQ